jgi:hypothetical protein
MLLLGDTLMRGERQLVATGKEDRVLQLRHDFQLVMRDELVEAVEHALGRKVTAFMSQEPHRPRPGGRDLHPAARNRGR